MTTLSHLISKKSRIAVGLMSGASVDCIETALLSIIGSGTSTKFKQLAFVSHPYPKGFREYVLKNSLLDTGNVETIFNIEHPHRTIFCGCCECSCTQSPDFPREN